MSGVLRPEHGNSKEACPVCQAGSLNLRNVRGLRPIIVRKADEYRRTLFERSQGWPNEQLLITHEHCCSLARHFQCGWPRKVKWNTTVAVGYPHRNGNGYPLQEILLFPSTADNNAVEVVMTVRI